jgi:hypothetical protein
VATPPHRFYAPFNEVKVATAAYPARTYSRRGARWLRRVRDLARTTTVRTMRPAKPVLANLASIPLTVAGFGCLDAAAFMWNTLAGLAAAGLLLIALEHMIADEQ